MNQESMPLRVRACRVIDYQEEEYCRFIVIEDVECARFRVGRFSFAGGRTEEIQEQMDQIYEAMKAKIDRDDAREVLESLRDARRFPESAWTDWPVADSIDAAVSQGKMRFRESMERFFPGKIPIPAPSEPEPTGESSKPVVMPMPGGTTSESEHSKQMIKEVWDFAGRKRLYWKPIGSTPAGRKCEVLTFDESEEVLVGADSIDIPTENRECDIE
jgi:hypothetical protein